MYVVSNEVEKKDIGGGITRKILAYDEELMSAELSFEKGAIGAMHTHPHIQIGYIISGSLLYKEAGCEDKILNTGDTYYVAPNISHGVVALEDTLLLDIFTPMRKDFL